ncbi:MAG: hypothetical protein EOM26_11365 [Alphaproteobacteria bacterium]|nr:hypothetical protein [Alphaproteobacteria bacterium]
MGVPFIVPPLSLQQQWGGNREFLTISTENIRKPGFSAILQQAHQGLYLQNFPLTKDGESLSEWNEHLTNPLSDIDYRIILAGRNLRNGTPEINGICVVNYYKDSDTAILSYIAVDESCRTEGLGYQLREIAKSEIMKAAHENGRSLRGWFLDCEDPRKVSEMPGRYSPTKRLNKYVGWGGKVVPCDFVIPVSGNPNKRDRDSVLVAFPHPETSEYPKPEAITDYLVSLFRHEGVERPRFDPDFMDMSEQIRIRWGECAPPNLVIFASDPEAGYVYVPA